MASVSIQIPHPMPADFSVLDLESIPCPYLASGQTCPYLAGLLKTKNHSDLVKQQALGNVQEAHESLTYQLKVPYHTHDHDHDHHGDHDHRDHFPDRKGDTSRSFTIASRASQLAQVQTNMVMAQLRTLYESRPPSPQFPPSSPLLTIPPVSLPVTPSGLTASSFSTYFTATAGDINQSAALYLMGGKALWTKELEVSLLNKDVDMLVHSLKDVPTVLPEGCIIGAILKREDPVDSLVVKDGINAITIDQLPDGSVVGTSSVRRTAQLRRKFPNLKFMDVRGNLNTRLSKLESPYSPYAAIILAKAGLVRLGFGDRITSDIPPPTLFHAVSQGALGVEIRADDQDAWELCRAITHRPTEVRCEAERAMLRVLEGGCSVPVGVASKLSKDDSKIETLALTGCVTSLDGLEHIELTVSKSSPSEITLDEARALGQDLAKQLLKNGAQSILDYIVIDREQKAQKAEEKGEKIEALEVGPA